MAKPKIIVITGGVLSGLGKGIVTSSIAYLLKAQGFRVSSVKIDPYINVDAGTMRPTEHGEVFVTYDGGETDQDLGNYERFLDVELSKASSITTGQVYLSVIQRERNLEYDGKCVEVIPHIPQEVQRRITEAAEKGNADFLTVEVGGVVGDYQNVLFLEALREMKRAGGDVLFVHVAYLPVPSNLGEMKTKPAQHSVRALNTVGIMPDFIVARASKTLDDVRKDKLAMLCNVDREAIIAAPDVQSIYEVPLLFEEQGFGRMILERLGLSYKTGKLVEWEDFVQRIRRADREIAIAIVGKYFDTGDFTLEDSYVSVIEALKHACWANGVKPKLHWLDSKVYEQDPAKVAELGQYHAVLVPGGFGGSGVEGKIHAIRYAREHGVPYLGLCYGMQLAVVEFARNVCGLQNAHTAEINRDTPHPVIDVMPEQKKNLQDKNYGATMRLGDYTANLASGSQIAQLYGSTQCVERHRHRYEVNPEFVDQIEAKGMRFSGRSPDRKLVEFMELPGHPYFVGTQAHPEFKSRPLRPHPLFDGLIKAALARQT